MADQITREIFEHLVELAAFELDPDEAEYLLHELNGQMDAIRELEAIEIGEDVPITSHGIPYSPLISSVLREDVNLPCSEAEDILEGAPEIENRYIVVPDIPHEQIS
jgi:aspartyl/glutamyl-tRNA(Asn/Gln) amidotransferase C subunit